MPAEDVAGQRRGHEARVRVRVVQPADLERDEAVLAELDRLLDAALLEVPEVQLAAVAAGHHVLDVEARLVRVRLTELR